MRSTRSPIAAAVLLLASSGWNLGGPTRLSTVGQMVTPRLGVGVGLDRWTALGPSCTA